MDKSSECKQICNLPSKLLLRPSSSVDVELENNDETKSTTIECNQLCADRTNVEYLIKAIEEEIVVRPCENVYKNNITGLFDCFKCNFSAKAFCHLKPHLYNHLLIKPYACLFCDFESVYEKSFKSHKAFHQEYNQPLTKFDFNFTCDISNKEDNSSIASTSNSSHSDASLLTSDSILNCLSCSFKAMTPASLESHAKIHLMKDKVLRCLDCTFESNTNFGLKIHVKKIHSKLPIHYEQTESINQSVDELQTFSCSLCPYVGLTSLGLKTHSQVHSRGKFKKVSHLSKVFSCTLCPFKSLSFDSFKNHSLIKHGKKNKRKEKLSKL